MRRTGRASGAVARAVDALVRRGLIDVLDGAERPLMTPAERRRCLGRLYYRLHKPDGGVGTGHGKFSGGQKRTRKTAYNKRDPIQK